MKKISFIICIGFFTLLLQSCTHTCTCEDPNGVVKELEVDPSENCSARSSAELGICS